ncbi:MAG: isochorismatase family protein [Woeseiaceae bacterium]|nr:isochorismatase family protein [Woeseiaceae bacterium]
MTDDLTENYADTFDGSLGFGQSPALILVDIVQAYFEESSPLYAGVEDELETALSLVEEARKAAVPIFYTNVVYQAGGADGGIFYQKLPALSVFDEGNELGDWADGVEPDDDEFVISKQYPSAFFGTSLASTLTSLGVDTLVIAGVTTSGCVRATCVDAMSYGFIPIVVSDACGDRHNAPHEANLFDMQAKYADVVESDAVLDYLRQVETE